MLIGLFYIDEIPNESKLFYKNKVKVKHYSNQIINFDKALKKIWSCHRKNN